MSENGLIYFQDGEVVAESGDAKVYQMNDELFLEIGPGHTLWALQSELSDYIEQLGDLPRGDVLEIGLGLGVASRYLLTFDRVSRLTTIEVNENVIEVYKMIRDRLYDERDLQVIGDKQHIILNTDGLIYLYSTKFRYDFIFLDFYDRIDEETLPIIKDMVVGCKRVLKPGGKIVGWLDPHTPGEFESEFMEIFSKGGVNNA